MTATLAPGLADTVRPAVLPRRRRIALAMPGCDPGLSDLRRHQPLTCRVWLSGRGWTMRAILLSDFWSHKTHVTRDNRTGDRDRRHRGRERRAPIPAGSMPDWVQTDGRIVTIDLGQGHVVTYDDAGARYVVPGYGTIDIHPEGGKPVLTAPQPMPGLDQRVRQQVSRHHRCRAVQLFPLQGRNLPISNRVGAVLLHPRQPVLLAKVRWRSGRRWRCGATGWIRPQSNLGYMAVRVLEQQDVAAWRCGLGHVRNHADGLSWHHGARRRRRCRWRFWRRATSCPRARCALPCGGCSTSCAGWMG